MRRLFKLLISVAVTLFAVSSARAQGIIERLDLRECDAGSAARLLSSLSGEKVIATEAAKAKKVDLLLDNASLEDCLKAICRSAGLVYRFDGDSRLYTIMGLDEYQKGSLNEAEGLYETKVFKVAAANLNQIAYALESLFGERVLLTEGEPVEDFRQDPSGGGSGTGGSFGTSDNGSGSFDGSNQQTSFNRRGYSSDGGGYNSYNRSDRRSGGRNYGGYGDGGGTFQQRSNVSNEAALALETARSEADTGTTQGVREKADERERRARASTQNVIYVTTNPEHSLLIIRTADLSAVKEISALVDSLDRPVPQVILEMKILQLDVGNDLTAGTKWQISQGDDAFEVTECDLYMFQKTDF
jgi:hypothetical protein